MSPDIVVLLLVAVPALLFMVLRVNAALAFLSACLGAVLLHYVGNDAVDFANMFLPWLNGNNLKLALILLPVVLTTIFMAKTIRGGRLILNLFPAIGTGLLLSLMIVPLLPADFSQQVQDSMSWAKIEQLQSLVVGVSALVCLFFLWTQRHKHAPHDKRPKHH